MRAVRDADLKAIVSGQDDGEDPERGDHRAAGFQRATAEAEPETSRSAAPVPGKGPEEAMAWPG
jgi:hypothetical protein